MQKAGNQVFFINFSKFSCCWIRVRIPNTDPDPAKSIRIRIQNMAFLYFYYIRRALEQAETEARKQTLLKPLTPRGLNSPTKSPHKGYRVARPAPQLGQVDLPNIMKVFNQVRLASQCSVCNNLSLFLLSCLNCGLRALLGLEQRQKSIFQHPTLQLSEI